MRDGRLSGQDARAGRAGRVRLLLGHSGGALLFGRAPFGLAPFGLAAQVSPGVSRVVARIDAALVDSATPIRGALRSGALRHADPPPRTVEP
ncbi:hypothetical protein C5C18_14740 [Rathayibacter tritici]|nr:hypothetical protein C5C06_06145 [Rathayibacter tritici]PPF62153.1 hypothetical protein C5C21_14380 [Rathayibacter tritici]PPG02214.1 hypothetical protein C5C18_14740 [Rathayibacter tritici]PPI19922.1 hypothetical protein C5D07_00870 [Rathayibacter tritici]PPI50098.1 hypothetical protein C5D18_01030 [Rathayibacter tritici]